MSNPYLFARFDGAVIDAKPWGHGQLSLEHAFPEAPQTEAERDLERLQGCHPLAMGHFANHPGKGMRPNVMVAPLDLSFSPTMPNKHRRLRAYIPNLTFYERGTEPRVSDDIMGAVLIALRDLRDEEVFLNYRLTPHVSRPEWYEPVDVEEEWRRWA
ncbi:unnamed protein product [Ostreobium quekettii]|uniref:SET domain-containing protein n=1 Tax=Ostreobium quekettii TaxID=121088 RepID=A0A8S1ITV3_9CHLO|nr:unnamed protein product [Ostreobium quekettii]